MMMMVVVLVILVLEVLIIMMMMTNITGQLMTYNIAVDMFPLFIIKIS